MDTHPIGALLAQGPRAYAPIGNGAIARLVLEHGHGILNAEYDRRDQTTPLSHALGLLVTAYARARSLYWPHVTVCRLLELGARRLAPAHAGYGPPWCTLLALFFEGGAPLHFGADIGGRAAMRSAHVAHWNHLLTLLQAVRRHTHHHDDRDVGWRFAGVWRERILPDLLGEHGHNMSELRHLVHMLLEDLLPLRTPSERALLTTLLADIPRHTRWRIDPWLTYTQWGALGTLPPNHTYPPALAHLADARPHCERRTRLVRRLLDARLLPADVAAHVLRLHNRSLMLPPFCHEADRGWDLRLLLLVEEDAATPADTI